MGFFPSPRSDIVLQYSNHYCWDVSEGGLLGETSEDAKEHRSSNNQSIVRLYLPKYLDTAERNEANEELVDTSRIRGASPWKVFCLLARDTSRVTGGTIN